jgi:hypothetical protein
VIVKIKGIWFFGFSGSGKSFIARILKKFIKNSFEIDGDVVRQTLSKDLNYSLKSRKVQIDRIFSISKLCILNNYFPIASTVYMNKVMLNKCKKNSIIVVRIKRNNFKKIISTHKTYKNKNNVVGRDIKLNNLNCLVIKNPGDDKIWKEIKLLKKLLKENAF